MYDSRSCGYDEQADCSGPATCYRARYYEPDMGRFLNPDPIGISGGPNLYLFVSGNPINSTDPSGLRGNSVLDRIGRDMKKAVVVSLSPKCAEFIVDLIKKANQLMNQRAHLRQIGIPRDIYAEQYAGENLGTFIVTMMTQTYVPGNMGSGYGAHVSSGSGPVYVDAGYDGYITLIHETFHKSAYDFSDMGLADALSLPYVEDPTDPNKTRDNASVAWDCKLREACK